MTNINIAAVGSVTCSRCGATPGQVCVTHSGRRATHTHSSRIEPLRRMWVEGYEEAVDDLLKEIDRAGVLDRMPAWMQRQAARRTA